MSGWLNSVYLYMVIISEWAYQSVNFPAMQFRAELSTKMPPKFTHPILNPGKACRPARNLWFISSVRLYVYITMRSGGTTTHFLFFYSAHATRLQHSHKIANAVSIQLTQETYIIWQTSLFTLWIDILSRPVSLINLCYHLKGVKVFERSFFSQDLLNWSQ